MRFSRKRSAALVIGTVCAATLVAAPMSASATPGPVLAHEGSPHCVVSGGELTWGVKSSFREYITGSIANGSWEPSGGASYVPAKFTETGAIAAGTDTFAWAPATGEVESDLSSGSVDFTGEVFFSGHSGALQLTVTDPSIEFDGADGYLVLTMGDSDGAGPTEVRAAKLDLSNSLTQTDAEIVLTDAPVRLTAEGAAGLNGTKGYGTYTAGQEIDPLNLKVTVADCAGGETAVEGGTSATEVPAEEPAATEEAVNTSASTGVPVMPIVAGGVALLVIIGAAVMLLRGRKTTAKTPEQNETNASE